MDHTSIVRAENLEMYADQRESQSVIPELVFWLVRQSVSDVSMCRIPYGNTINQPGWDGIVETEGSFLEFVPNGTSFWEIGTGRRPQGKATRVFNQRTKCLPPEIRSKSTFVFVTPRSSGVDGWNEPKQTNWKHERQNSGWQSIRIIDGVKLADWLRDFPSIGRWMAAKIGMSDSLGGFTTPKEHWEILLSMTAVDDPDIPPELFVVGRSDVCGAVKALFDGRMQKLLLFVESEHDVADFVAAYIATLDESTARSYANRCILISNEDAWRSVIEVQKQHVLVASPQLGLDTEEKSDLLTIAIQKGHAVIVPISGIWYNRESPDIVKLRNPTQSQIETVLKEADYSETRARELAGYGGDSVSALRRHLQGFETLPPYATWENSRPIARAILMGKWDGNRLADRTAIETLLGKAYGEWIETIRTDSLRSGSPLVQINEKWRFIARGEAWNSLGNTITDDDLDRFKKAAISVLGELDPKFDLPKDDRFMANIHGKQLNHSNNLREGLAESLALVGSRPQALISCSDGKPESVATEVVHQILHESTWETWGSLDSLLPQFAEAAPDAFLSAVESQTKDLENSQFHFLFEQEGGGEVGGWNYISGLLWALETLAWHPDYLCRVSVVLADLAKMDPGGNWANRPSNSLVSIFLPWFVQTSASIEIQRAAVNAVINEHPSVGWNLVMDLMPHAHGSTSGCHKPTWRDFIPREWSGGFDESTYRELVIVYTNMAVGLAKTDTEKLIELIDRLINLPSSAEETLLHHLVSDQVKALDDSDRMPIWEKLNSTIRKNRRFPNASWAMSKESITELEEIADILAPRSPVYRYRYLFNEGIHELYYSDSLDYEEQRIQIEQDQKTAIQSVISHSGIEAIKDFAQSVASPREVGTALVSETNDEIEFLVLDKYLNSDDEIEQQIVSGYLWKQYSVLGVEWVENALGSDWSMEKKAKLLTLLPFENAIWQLVDSHIDEKHQRLYWQNTNAFVARAGQDINYAVGRLLDYGRSPEALHCIWYAKLEEQEIDINLAVRTLQSILETQDAFKRVRADWIVDIIQYLQDSAVLDTEVLFLIEWRYLPFLGQFSSGSPKTLENHLSSNPAIFTKILSFCYRSKNEKKPSQDKIDSQRAELATNAYRLLDGWKKCPGVSSDGSFDKLAFKNWIDEVEKITDQSGHLKHAKYHIGKVLVNSPVDPDGLWIHQSVASVLNDRDAAEMRSGFTTELFNRRGAFFYSAGEEELKLEQDYRAKARELDIRGFTRFATAIRSLAEDYKRQADRDAKRDPYDN
ncbi:MAG: hypothetical protein OXH02_06670 [Gemmatimonadetes bacterium]|nr:hypothetical protein [Gemmatimonadota bacterium]